MKHKGTQERIDELEQELDEWRRGARRVFWRLTFDAKCFRFHADYAHQSKAHEEAKGAINPKVYRVTVRPKA